LKRKLQLPIYVINGFYGAMKESYESPSNVVHFMVLEWEAAKLSWKDMLFNVVGDRVPSVAMRSSIRGCAYHEWQSLQLLSQPNSKDNCVHISFSALEALHEKKLWMNLKNETVALQSDPIGAQFLSAQMSLHILQKWLGNPLVNNVSVFDHMHGLGIEHCVAKSKILIGSSAQKKSKLIERLSASAKRSIQSPSSPSLNQMKDFKSNPSTPIKSPEKSSNMVVSATKDDISDDDDDDVDLFEEIRKTTPANSRPQTAASLKADVAPTVHKGIVNNYSSIVFI